MPEKMPERIVDLPVPDILRTLAIAATGNISAHGLLKELADRIDTEYRRVHPGEDERLDYLLRESDVPECDGNPDTCPKDEDGCIDCYSCRKAYLTGQEGEHGD